jgi:hypothetical protein
MYFGLRMKILVAKIASTAAVFLAATVLFAAPPKEKSGPVSAATKRTPVVVELFTSEGCSSCPSADTLLKSLEQHQPYPDAEVIPIEEHVDYWNHDGWVDPFSSANWTFRQEAYVRKLKANTEYTPQMVVDGQTQFSGNDILQVVVAVNRAARSPHVNVSISPGKSDGKDAQDFAVSVGKLVGTTSGNSDEVWLAVTEDDLHSSVGAGENAGHVLYHAAVLRSLTKIGIANAAAKLDSFTGDPRVKFSSHWNRKNLHVVVFVQEKQSKRILGAALTSVKPVS